MLVTANYKLTVDKVRKELAGLNVWLLVLDTNGVNGWCAAGKGTFAGVAAHEVKRATGFTVHYEPVRAHDIRVYLAAEMKTTPRMRRVTFNWKERIVVTPVEVVGGMKWAFVALAVLALLDLIRHAASLER